MLCWGQNPGTSECRVVVTDKVMQRQKETQPQSRETWVLVLLCLHLRVTLGKLCQLWASISFLKDMAGRGR